MTRTRRNCDKANGLAQQDLNNMKNDIINPEVAEIAVTIHGVLSVICNNYSSDVIIDLVPEITSLLNKYDASLKVNNDLQECLDGALKENQLLVKTVNLEKNKRKQDFEDSLHCEQIAETEIENLKMEVERLKISQISLKREIESKNTIIGLLRSDCEKLSHTADYNVNGEFLPSKHTKKPKSRIPGFSLQTENRYSILQDESDSQSRTLAEEVIHTQVVSDELLAPASETQPRKVRTKSMNIRFYADSQGRDVYENFNDDRHKFFSMIKPGAKFKDVVEETGQLNACDINVFLAGTNDVACNERKELHSSLRDKLRDLQNRRAGNVIVFSVPHRHDLPNWSAINKEIREANQQNAKLCHRFKNVSFVNIGNIGRRFHTSNGLHLNTLGKKYVGDKILELANDLAREQEKRAESITLKYHNDHFLEVGQTF
jgi:hypothetical protein